MIVWFCNDFENKASQRQFELETELKFTVRDLESYGAYTQEWREREAQLNYGNIKQNLARRIILRIGLAELRGEMGD